MALTPEDVVNKRFNPTKFREGYDQDEVDDFLDEVVVELRRLGQENEELRQRLIASDARISELQRSASQAPLAAAAPPAPVVAPEPVAVPIPAPAPAVASAAPEFAAQDQGSMDQSNTNNLLQLARRLHEEHVREGMEKRDQLVAEGHATAARIVSDAETQQRTRIESLEAERAHLERSVEELRIFESEYREKLKGYIEGQLRELESAAPLGGTEEQSALGSQAPAYAEPVAFGSPAPEPVAFGSQAPEFAAPAYGAPEYAAPVEYAAPAEYATPAEYPNAFAQPADASAPPAYAGFPAPQPAEVQQPEQQPDYPAYSQRNDEYPGLGGN